MANGIVSATLNVEQVLKGATAPGSSIFFNWIPPASQNSFAPAPNSGSRSLQGHGIFFLRRDAAGSWSVLPATVGDVSWDDVYIHTPATAPIGLRQVVAGSVPLNPSALDNVLVEMVITVEASAALPYDLVAIARETRSPVLTAAFSRYLAKQDPALFLLGLRGSLLSGDPSAIQTAQQQSAALSSVRGWQALVQEIKIYYVNNSPQAVQILGQVATNTSVGLDLRSAAAGALARIHTKQSLPYLAALLAEQDGTLKAMGVGGLASFANNVPIGSHEPAPGAWQYRTNDTIAHSAFDPRTVGARESYYVGFWQNWWQQNQNTLTP
jgi:hypothetical protein